MKIARRAYEGPEVSSPSEPSYCTCEVDDCDETCDDMDIVDEVLDRVSELSPLATELCRRLPSENRRLFKYSTTSLCSNCTAISSGVSSSYS